MKKLRENLLGLFIVLRNNYNNVQVMDSFIDKFTMVEFERQNTAFKKMKLNTLSRSVTVALWRVNRNFSLELQISSYMYILTRGRRSG